MRWWDGETWTAEVVDGNRRLVDPVDTALLMRLHEADGDLRARWPWWAIALSIGSLVVGNIATSAIANATRAAGAAAAVALSAGALYAGLIVVAVVVHRTSGTGSFRDAYGLGWRWSDLAIGAAASIAGRIAAILVVLPVVLANPDLGGTNVPERSVVEGRTALLVVITIVAVVVAPIVEELFFRGVLQRTLEVSMRPWLGVAVASIAFGFAHIDVSRGWGNVSVVLATASGGAIFGALYRVFRRLGPSMVAHALFNCVAIALLWTVV